MERRSVKGVAYFTSEGFKDSARYALNAFATRIGGVSGAPFNTLDFGAVSENGLKDRADNLLRLGFALGVEPLECALVKQVHGDTIVKFDPVDAKTPDFLKRFKAMEADAIVTATRGVAVGVLTADCLPVFLYDPVTGAVAAVHAGWRGTFLSIVKKTVAFMVKEYGARPVDLRAALGPCIGLCCYAVSGDFYEKFLTSFGNSINDFFLFSSAASGQASAQVSGNGTSYDKSKVESGSLKKGGGVAFDLQAANRAQLIEAGVQAKQIDNVHECTACNPHHFFSYRRDVTAPSSETDVAQCAAEHRETGRMLSMVMAGARVERTEP